MPRSTEAKPMFQAPPGPRLGAPHCSPLVRVGGVLRGAHAYKGNAAQHTAQQSKTPTPHPPQRTTKATRTNTTQKGCFPDALPGANTFPTTPGSGSRGVTLAGGWQPATRLTMGQRPKTCTAHE